MGGFQALIYLTTPKQGHTTYEFFAILISCYVDSTIRATADHTVNCVLVDCVMRGAIFLVVGKIGDGIERFLYLGEQESDRRWVPISLTFTSRC